MNKAVSITLASLACFALCLGFLLLSVNFIGFNTNFYTRQFNKAENSTRLWLQDPNELDAVRDQLASYLIGRSDTLQVYVTFYGGTEPKPFYTQDELDHMADVKTVFTSVRLLAVVLLVAGFYTLLGLKVYIGKNKEQSSENENKPDVIVENKNDFPKTFALGAIIGSGLLLFVSIIIGLFMVFGFDAAFELFHEVFFPQGNWQFSYSSNMIRMLPERLFLMAGIIILLSGLIFTLAMLASGILILCRNRKEKETSVAFNKTNVSL